MLHIFILNFSYVLVMLSMMNSHVFSENLHRYTETVHKLKVNNTSKLYLAYLNYVQPATPKVSWTHQLDQVEFFYRFT